MNMSEVRRWNVRLLSGVSSRNDHDVSHYGTFDDALLYAKLTLQLDAMGASPEYHGFAIGYKAMGEEVDNDTEDTSL